MQRIFVMSLHSEDLIVTHVNPNDTIAEVKKGFEGAGIRALLLDGRELLDHQTIEESCVPADCTLEWSEDEACEKSPESGFMASNVSGAFTVSRNGSVTSTRRAPCPPESFDASPAKSAAPANVCTHWLESGTCPFGERCHFSATHTEENAGREHAILLAGKPVCKHWVSEGSCPLKSCYWKATHTPQNSPRYAKYLKATPMAPITVCPPVVQKPPPEAPSHRPAPNPPITVMKRQPSQPPKTQPITVMKRQQPPRAQQQQQAYPQQHHNKHMSMRSGAQHQGGVRSAALEIKDPAGRGGYSHHPQSAPGQPVHVRGPRIHTAPLQRPPGPLPASYVHKKPQQRGSRTENGGRNRRKNKYSGDKPND